MEEKLLGDRLAPDADFARLAVKAMVSLTR
jgi:hypothetical protein